MPPRHGKSELVSHYFMVWLLNLWPHKRVMVTSYEANFAATWGQKVRDSINANQDILSVSVRRDTSARNRWNTTAGGGMVTSGAQGPMMGRGADALVYDDPIKNPLEAQSQDVLDNVWELFQSAYTRLEPKAFAAVVMQRWSDYDIVGRLLELQESPSYQGERWHVISFPAIATQKDALGRSPGDALWPSRYDIPALMDKKSTLDDWIWNATYQQIPSVPGGSIFKREWWELDRNRYDYSDIGFHSRTIARYLTFDTAQKVNTTSAYSVGGVGDLLDDWRLAIKYIYRDKVEFPRLIDMIVELSGRYNRDGKLRGVLIEDKSSGISAIQTLRQNAPDWLKPLIIPFEPHADKETRWRNASVWCRNNCVLLPFASDAVPWLFDFENEIFKVPNSMYKDQADIFAQLITYLEHYIATGHRIRTGVVAEE